VDGDEVGSEALLAAAAAAAAAATAATTDESKEAARRSESICVHMHWTNIESSETMKQMAKCKMARAPRQ
jgi:ABC-type glycerol-3-phosphate transport system substrate-binding protein